MCPACDTCLDSSFWRIFPLALLAVLASEGLALYALVLFVRVQVFGDSLAFLIWAVSFGMAGYLAYWACFDLLCKFKQA